MFDSGADFSERGVSDFFQLLASDTTRKSTSRSEKSIWVENFVDAECQRAKTVQ